jgi:signal transduction histidine kinase
MLEERRQLERDIVAVSEHEQQRIGQDLHDGLCQQLAAIGCAARMLAEDLKSQGVPAAHDAILIEDSVQQAVLEARNLARGIFPVHVDHSGLSAALAELAQTTSRLTAIEIGVSESVEVSLDDPEVSMNLYRIAQEAVANAVKHGAAQKIFIHLSITSDELVLTIEDDGLGISEKAMTATSGMGLRTMRYRAQSLGALFDVCGCHLGGTRVICRLRLQTTLTDQSNA